MSDRMDITSRNLFGGQNDSAAAERLEFPGFRRSWNIRGSRETARRRMGLTQSSTSQALDNGMGTISSASDAERFYIAQNPFLTRENLTIDFCFACDDPSAAHNEFIVGQSALATPGLFLASLNAGTLTVTIPTVGPGNITFTHAGIVASTYYFVRISHRGDETRFYIGGAAAQVHTHTSAYWFVANNPTWVLGDYTGTSVENRHLQWLRVFSVPMFHRNGMNEMYPRPRSREVQLNLMYDPGEGFLTDGATSYVQDFSSYQRHAAIDSTITGSAGYHHFLYNQFAGDGDGRGVANDRMLIVADGDVIPGVIS